MRHKLDKTAGMLHKERRGLSKEGQGEGRWGVGGCHSECINSNEWGYIKKNCRAVLSFLGVFNMKVEWNGRCVL